ncbi:MAG: hypothetical protein ACOC80_14275 [Petrotogales bacterium]
MNKFIRSYCETWRVLEEELGKDYLQQYKKELIKWQNKADDIERRHIRKFKEAHGYFWVMVPT